MGYNQHTPAEVRFWERVERLGADECWKWTGGRSRGDGEYGTFDVDGRVIRVHRFSYEIHKGPIPDGLVIDHLCCNKLCVNPSHLEAVTNEENMSRWARRLTHCSAGHEFNEKNTKTLPSGFRVCRVCGREKQARYIAANPRPKLIRMSPLSVLAHNLAIGSALCRAHENALYESDDHRLYHEHGYRIDQCWSPGCGKSAP